MKKVLLFLGIILIIILSFNFGHLIWGLMVNILTFILGLGGMLLIIVIILLIFIAYRL